jgi:hypothetical protein
VVSTQNSLWDTGNVHDGNSHGITVRAASPKGLLRCNCRKFERHRIGALIDLRMCESRDSGRNKRSSGNNNVPCHINIGSSSVVLADPKPCQSISMGSMQQLENAPSVGRAG